MASSASSSSPLPSDRALDDAVRALAERGLNVAVVQIVDAWASQGSPSQEARLYAGRAFLSLRMMDRAVSRAREVLDQEPGHPDALRLLAEAYLVRGWPAKARAPLAQLRAAQPDDPAIEALWAQAHADAARPDPAARQIERDGPPDQQIALAEAFLASGSFLRATGILERLRRTSPDDPRVGELLWGLAGDTSLGSLTVADLIRELLPVAPLPAVGALDEPEFTESYTETTQGKIGDVPVAAVDEAAFPTLFKHGATPIPDDDATGEHTSASHIASPDELAYPPLGDTTDGGDADMGGSGHGDTQIMLVLRPGEEVKSTAHRRRPHRDGLRENLNLREYQASMGMSGTVVDPYGSDLDVDPEDELERSEALPLDTPEPDELDPDADDLLEEEDESIVVMTRMEDAPAAVTENTESLARPIEVIEKHPVPAFPPPPPAWVDPGPATEAPWAPAPSNRWLIVALAGIALVMLAAFGVILGSRMWSETTGESARSELLEALGGAEYDRLLEAESVLDAQLRSSDSPAVAAALAEARLVLWSDFNGDPARMDYVQSVLADAGAIDVHRLAMLRAATAFAREDYAGANAAISRQAPEDDEERLLFARLASRSEDPSRALEQFTRMARPDAPRYALARADVLSALGRTDDALSVVRQVLRNDPDHVLGNLAQARLIPARAEARVAAAQLFLTRARGSSLPPRVEGAAHALRARGYAEIEYYGKAREAADAGLARDGGNPDLLLVVADAEAQSGDLDAALGELHTIVTSRPGNAAAQTARVLLLLDMDRVEKAEAVITELRTATLLPELTPVLQGLVTAWGRTAPPANPPGPKAAGTALGAWMTAVVAAQSRSSDAPAAVDLAVERLLASTDPFERRLVPRARAMRLLVTPAAEAAAMLEEIEPKVVSDPAAHVLLGRYYESIGRRALAAQHFDRAAELGPQVGLAWYEKGRFYLDARDSQGRSAEAWRTYLKLGPSGPRADRVTASLRR